MRPHELLQHVGLRLFGAHWQGQICAIIGVSERSMRRWVAGVDQIPPGVWTDILGLVRSRWGDLRELESFVRDVNRIAVYGFEVYDTASGRSVRQKKSKRTAADIEQLGGKIVPGTQQIVDQRSLDDQGRFIMPPDGAEWSVGDVQSTTEGYGFSIVNKFRAPITSFSFPSMALAKASHGLMAAALGDATLVVGHSA
jgi:hypothetical protein